jgi:hypothetical protein
METLSDSATPSSGLSASFDAASHQNLTLDAKRLQRRLNRKGLRAVGQVTEDMQRLAQGLGPALRHRRMFAEEVSERGEHVGVMYNSCWRESHS